MTTGTDNTREERIADLHETITAAQPGTLTTWSERGITISVQGQHRTDLDTQTPAATITIDGTVHEFHSWDQLLDTIDNHADALAAAAEPELNYA